MHQMHELKNNIKEVLDSHKPDSKERKYISDNDLKMMHAILSVFTKDFSSTQKSAFDDFLKEQDKPAEQPQEQEENETLISDPGRYPIDKSAIDETSFES